MISSDRRPFVVHGTVDPRAEDNITSSQAQSPLQNSTPAVDAYARWYGVLYTTVVRAVARAGLVSEFAIDLPGFAIVLLTERLGDWHWRSSPPLNSPSEGVAVVVFIIRPVVCVRVCFVWTWVGAARMRGAWRAHMCALLLKVVFQPKPPEGTTPV